MLIRDFDSIFSLILTLFVCLVFKRCSVDAQSDDYSDDVNDVQDVNDGQGIDAGLGCAGCPIQTPGENPQGLFGKPSLMQTLSGARVRGYEDSFGKRLTDLLFGPVPTPSPLQPVTRVVRQTGSRGRGRGRGRIRGGFRGRRRRPFRRGRGRGGRRPLRPRFRDYD